MDIVRRLLNRVLAGQYEFTDHALESMDEDRLTLKDVIHCLGRGRLRRSWRRQREY